MEPWDGQLWLRRQTGLDLFDCQPSWVPGGCVVDEKADRQW